MATVVWTPSRCIHGVEDDVCWPCTYLGPEVPIEDVSTLQADLTLPWSVPRYLPGATVVCVGSGWNLNPQDVRYAAGRAPVVAVNDAYRLAPWAEVHYACDRRWWDKELGARAFRGRYRATLDSAASITYGVRLLGTGPRYGLSFDPAVLCHGQSGGYQALNLAVLTGAARVLLLGYDYRPSPTGEHYWHGDDRWRGSRSYARWLEPWPTVVEPLAQAGVEVVNCSPGSVLSCFPFRNIREVL